ncbi:hypothetical protein F5890DRAFT_1419104, partial [Lentinula detonsa]
MKSTAARQRPRGPVHYIWVGDFNRHHPIWDEPRNHHLFTARNLEAAQHLLSLNARYRMQMALPEHLPTLCTHNSGNYTRVDNVFCSEDLMENITVCRTIPAKRP